MTLKKINNEKFFEGLLHAGHDPKTSARTSSLNSPSSPQEVSNTVTPVLQLRKLSQREGKEFAQGHTG